MRKIHENWDPFSFAGAPTCRAILPVLIGQTVPSVQKRRSVEVLCVSDAPLKRATAAT